MSSQNSTDAFIFTGPELRKVEAALHALGCEAVRSQKITQHDEANAAMRKCRKAIEAIVAERGAPHSLRSALGSPFVTTVSGGGQKPYLRLTYPTTDAVHTAHDALADFLRDAEASRTPAGAAGDPVGEADAHWSSVRCRRLLGLLIEAEDERKAGRYHVQRDDFFDWARQELARPASPAPAASAGGEGVQDLAAECRARAALDEEISPRTLHAAANMLEHLVALAPAAQVNPGREEIAAILRRELIARHDYDSTMRPCSWIDGIDEAADAILAARPVAEGDAGWQPIETAPKDGSWFLSEHGGKVVLASRDEGTAYPWDIARIPISPNTAGLDGELKVWRPLPEPPAARPGPSPAKRGNGA